MNFTIDKKIPISIKEQLKRQIRGMIDSQLLIPGQAVPSCSDMSDILSISRNTVAAAYAELSSEGILTSNRGAGTVVSDTAGSSPPSLLSGIFDEAFARAKKMGLSNEQITDQFFSSLTSHSVQEPQTILMVWCNRSTIEEVGKVLESKLGVKIRSMLVEEVEQFPDRARKALDGADLVVTSLNYIQSILALATEMGVEVTGIILTPVGRVLNEIVQLPEGTTVGFVCVNNLAAESTCKGVHLSGAIALKTIWAGADDSDRLKAMIAECDVVFATHHVYDQVVRVNSKGSEIIHLDLTLSESNLQIIKEGLARV